MLADGAKEAVRMEQWLRGLVAAGFIAGQLLIADETAAAPPTLQTLVYTVHHSRYGRIGTYTNTIMRDGAEISVDTEVRIAVSFLGITMFRQEASRQERWEDGRLVFFHGVTSTNGRSIELRGTADGDMFVLTTPEGPAIAPAGVRVANPWSAGFIGGKKMLTPDRGRLDEVRVSVGQVGVVDVAGRRMRAKKYEVYLRDGRKKYEVDLNDSGTPVQFILFNRDATVSFSLNG